MEKVIDQNEIESDVVVVGYGAAGAAAAITAYDSGVRVTILEKMPEGGGSSRHCAGIILAPTGMRMVQWVEALCCGVSDHEVIETYVTNALKTRDWIRDMGGETILHPVTVDVCFPGLPHTPGANYWSKVVGAEDVIAYQVKGNFKWAAESLWQLLLTNVKRREIKVLTNTSARELITNDKGEVVGVLAETEGKLISVKAKKAVILTTGGFEYNDRMKETYLPCGPFYGLGNPGNTGDGIMMAQKVGAEMWHMTIPSSPLGFKTPEYPAAFTIRMYGDRFILVDKHGKRFTNETNIEIHEMWRPVSPHDSVALDYPRIPAYAIFDEETRRRGPLWSGTTGYNRNYEWSLDNSKEIAKGWIKRGKTMRELAKQIGADESVLESTVARYNEYCKLGKDTDFGRPKEYLGTIEGSPYYAIPLWPCLFNTQGGPRRNKEAKVLNYGGTPIPRLYSAGSLGSLWGLVYDSGGNIQECLTFGRIAGKNAAAEIPW
jgi:succinate dehydrogenase/fumarate reductase flavoprotein subunit